MIRVMTARIGIILLTLIAASMIIFTMTNIVPGDPAAYMMGLNATPEAMAGVRAQLGLDQPVVARYLDWVTGMVRGDFGISYTYRVPVADLVRERISVSLPLALYALGLAALIGLPLGIMAAYWHRRAGDTIIMTISQIGIAVPNFWLALMLVGVFAMGLRWVSAGGFPGWQAGVGAGLGALTLPAIALALPQASILARMMRTSLLETMGADYIRTARAKGLSRRAAILRHGVRNAFVPVLTILGLQFSFLLAGSIIVEKIFFLPGLGQLILQAIAQRDLIVVQGVIMVLVASVLLVTLLVDLLYRVVDPRISFAARV